MKNNDSLSQNLKYEKKCLILSHSQGKSIYLQDCLIFPHHLDGLKVWEAGIVLSRYVCFNPELFNEKVVLDLGTGTGIASISALKYTAAKRVILSDYQPIILENALESLKFNKINHIHKFPSEIKDFQYCTFCGEARAIIQRFDWREQNNFDFQADCIIGSDIIYTGGYMKELFEVMSKQLVDGGKAYIVIPSFRQAKQEFLKLIESSEDFHYEVEELDENKYLASPFKETTEGYQLYKGLKELKFSMYIFTKKLNSEKEIVN